METDLKDEIPARKEPVQVTDQTLPQDESTRVFEPEIQENRTPEEQPVVPLFDLTKLSYELQQGYRIYVELLADSNRNVTWPFLDPVDAESLGLWDYYDRIKEPMCFATIGSKFNEYKYNSITEVVADMRLILENCYRYNGPDHWVSKLGQKLEKILEQKLALLNRSLRDKVTLLATMSLNQDLPLVAELEASGRRRSSRQNYLNMVNGENSSSLVNHVKIQEESEEKERRKQREKEKKEANQALLQDLVDWEKKELTPEIMNPLHSMWEIPSMGSFLYLVRNILGLEDINLTEFELSFIYPNKSSLLARIFTALLVTPHQRKSLYKKPVMTFKKWECKLKEKLDVWYKVAEKEGLYAVSIQYGIDLRFFDILGMEKNPLEEKSYLDLTLYQRVWMLKTLCDVCFHKDYDLREKVNSCDFMEQRELFLGNDAECHSYIYFPVFQTTDVRVYQHDQLEVPKLNIKTKKEPSPPPPLPAPVPERKKARKAPSKPLTPSRSGRPSRLRQLRGDTTPEENKVEEEPPSNPEPEEVNENESKPDPVPAFEAEDGFKLACHDIETLKTLAEHFAEPPIPPKKRGRRPKIPPPRKRCEVELHETLMALLQELDKYEGAFSRNYTKARIKIMKESLEPEAVEPEEPEETPQPEPIEEWGSELSDEDDGAKCDAKDEDFRIEDEYGTTLTLEDKQSKPDSEMQSNSDESENGSIKAMNRSSLRYTRKRKSLKTEDNTEVLNSESCSIALQTSNPRMKKKAKKWSPTRETVLPKSVSSPTVVISAVSAEESVKAASIPQKNVSIIKKLSHSESGDETRSISPKTILVNSLGEALKRAKTSPNKPQNSVADIKESSAQGSATTDVTSTVGPSSLQAQNLRKRILVSPEGKAHEVKPTTSTTSPLISPQEHPPIQRKTAVQIVVSKGEVTQSIVGTTAITTSRTVGMVSQNRGMLPNGSVPTAVTSTTGSHQRPNILSHSRKQILGKPGVVAQIATGNPAQGKVLVPTSAVSHNHKYALSSTSVNQGSKQSVGAVTPNTTTTVKMVQIIPSSKQTNIATANSLYVVPSMTAKPGMGVNTIVKAGAMSGQSVVKVTPPKASQGITPSGLSSHPKTTLTSAQVSSTQMSTLSSSMPAVTPKGAATMAVKTQAAKQTPGQTKVVFIPASSVDANSPLASFKPQTLTTTGGQSIYGYAVVVPPGSPEEVNAVISSALRKPTSVSVKATSVPMQQKQQQMTAQGKRVNQAVVTGKLQSLGISTLPGSQPRLAVGNITQPRPGAATSTIQARPGVPTPPCSDVTSITVQPRPGVPINTTQTRPGVPINTTQTRSGVPINTTQTRPGVSTTTAQTCPGVPINTTQTCPDVPINTTQTRPGVPTTTTQTCPGVPINTTQTRTGVPTTTTQTCPGVPTNTTQTRTGVPTTTTQPRPGVPINTAQPHPGVPINTTQTRFGVPTMTQPRLAVPTNIAQPHPSVPTSTAQTRPGVPTNTTQPRPGVPTVTTQPCPVVTTNTTQPRPGVPTNTTQPRPGVLTVTAQLRPGVPTVTAQPRPGVPSNTTQPRPGVPTVTAQPRPGVPTNTTQPRPGVQTVAPQPRQGVPRSTTHLGPGVTDSSPTTVATVPLSVAHVLVGSNTKQPLFSVSTSSSPTNAVAHRTTHGSSFTRPVETSTAQPCTGDSTNHSSSATNDSNVLPGNSTTESCCVTASPKPTTITVTASVCPKDLQSSSSIRGGIKNKEIMAACSSAQNITVSIPITQPLVLPTKVNDSTSCEQTGSVSATANCQKSCHSDQKPTIGDAKESNREIKNGTGSLPNVSSTNSAVAKISEAVNVSGSETLNSCAAVTSTQNIGKQTSSAPSANEKLPHPDKLIVKDESQNIVSYCNGVSVHPTLKNMDSIQNIESSDSTTPLADVDSVNGIPDVMNTKAPSLCSTTIHSPTVTSN